MRRRHPNPKNAMFIRVGVIILHWDVGKMSLLAKLSVKLVYFVKLVRHVSTEELITIRLYCIDVDYSEIFILYIKYDIFL